MLLVKINPLESRGNKRSYTLKKTCSYKFQVCLSMFDLLLPTGLKGLRTIPKWNKMILFMEKFLYKLGWIVSNF